MTTPDDFNESIDRVKLAIGSLYASYNEEIQQLRRENARMRKRLEEFADEDNWRYSEDGFYWFGPFGEPFKEAQQGLGKDEPCQPK
jgi:hypothetical protein